MDDNQMPNLPKKPKKRKWIIWGIIFPILLLTFSITGYGAYLYIKAEKVVNNSYKEVKGRAGKSKLREKKVDPHIDNISVLFIGIDGSKKRNYGDHTRSDALVLATLNVKEKSVKLLSIPRDSYVYIQKVGYKTKINHAHAFGGPEATIQTVEDLLNVPVDYYVEMNFYAFMDIVNSLGGIEVNVPYKISELNSKDKLHAIKLTPGYQTLNGEQALALARTRKQDNDIMRGERQQEIMKAILNKASSVQSLTKYSKLIDAIGTNMKTNMSFEVMRSLVEYGISDKFSIESLTLKGKDSYIGGIYYYQLDEPALQEIKTKLGNHLELDATTTNNTNTSTSNNTSDDKVTEQDSNQNNNNKCHFVHLWCLTPMEPSRH